jgi:uncharacterized RDD family membrane protein YckC
MVGGMRCHQCGLENAPGTPLCARCSAVLDLPTSPASTRPELARLPLAGEPGDTALDLRAPQGPRRRPLPSKAPEPRLAEPKSRRVAIPEGLTDPLSNPPVRGVAPLSAASDFESQTEQIQLPARSDRPTPAWEEVIAATPPELLLAWGAAREAEGPTAVSEPVSPLPEAPTHERSLTSLGQRPSAIAYEATDATETVSRPDSSATALDLRAVSRAELSSTDAAQLDRTRLDLPPVRVMPDAGRARVAGRPSEPAPPDSVRARVAPRPPRSAPRSPTEIDPAGPRPAEQDAQRVPTESLEVVRGPGESRVMPEPALASSTPRMVGAELGRPGEPRPLAAPEPLRASEPRASATVVDVPAPRDLRAPVATTTEPAARLAAAPRTAAPLSSKPDTVAQGPTASAPLPRPEPVRPVPRADELAPASTEPRARLEGLELPRARRIAPLATLAEAARGRESEGPTPLRTTVDPPASRLSGRATGTGDLPAPHRVPPPVSTRAPVEPVRAPARVAPLTTVDSPLPPGLRPARTQPSPTTEPVTSHGLVEAKLPQLSDARPHTPGTPGADLPAPDTRHPATDPRATAASASPELARSHFEAQPQAEISALDGSLGAAPHRTPSARPPIDARGHDELVSADFLHTDMALPKVRRAPSSPKELASLPLDGVLSARAGTAERAPSAITSTAARDDLSPPRAEAPSPWVPTVVGPAPAPSQSIELTFEPPTANATAGDARSRLAAPSPLFGQIPAPSAIAAMTTATGPKTGIPAASTAPTTPGPQTQRPPTTTPASLAPALAPGSSTNRQPPMAPSTIAAHSTITGARPGPTEPESSPPLPADLPKPFADLGGNEPTLEGHYTPELELGWPRSAEASGTLAGGAAPPPRLGMAPDPGAHEEATIGVARPATSAAVPALGTRPGATAAHPPGAGLDAAAGGLRAPSALDFSDTSGPTIRPPSPRPHPDSDPASPSVGARAASPLSPALAAPSVLARTSVPPPSALPAPSTLARGSVPPPGALAHGPLLAPTHSPIPPPSALPSTRPAASAIPAPSTLAPGALGLPAPPRPGPAATALPAPSTLRPPAGPARPLAPRGGLPTSPAAAGVPASALAAARASTGPDTFDPEELDLDLDLHESQAAASAPAARLPGMPLPTTRAGASPEPARGAPGPARAPQAEGTDDTRPLLEPAPDDAAKGVRSPWSLIDGPREIRTSVGELLAREAALAMREVDDPLARETSEPPVLPTALDAEDADESTRAAAPDDLARSGIDVGYDSGDAPLVLVARGSGESSRDAAQPPPASRSEERAPPASRSEDRPAPLGHRADARPAPPAARAEDRAALDPRARPAQLGELARPRAEPEPPTSGVMQRPRTDDLLMQASGPDTGGGHTMLGLLAPALLGPSDPELGGDIGESTRLAPAGALAGSLAGDLDLSEPPAQHTQLGVMVYGAPRRTEEPVSGPRSAPGFALAPDFADDAVPPWEVRAIRSEHEPARAPSRALDDDDFSPERTSPPDNRSRTASETPAFQLGLAEDETPMGAMSARGHERRAIPSDDTPMLGGLGSPPSARGFASDERDGPAARGRRPEDELIPRAYRPSEPDPIGARPHRPSEPDPVAARPHRAAEPERPAPRPYRAAEPDPAALRTLRAQPDTAPGPASLVDPPGRDESDLVARARDESDLVARATDDDLDAAAIRTLRNPRDDAPAAPRSMRDGPGLRPRDGRREVEPRPVTPSLLRNPRVSEPSDAWRIPQDETRAMPLDALSALPRSSTPAPAPGRAPMPSFADETAPRLDAPPRALTVASGPRLLLSHMIDLALTLGAIQGAALAGLLGPAWAAPLPSTPIALAEAVTGRPWPMVALAFVAVFTVGGALTTGLLGGTPGMLAAGLRLYTRRTGRRAGPARALLRAVVALLGLALAGLGYAWAVVDRDRRALHDRVVGTVLVRRERG